MDSIALADHRTSKNSSSPSSDETRLNPSYSQLSLKTDLTIDSNYVKNKAQRKKIRSIRAGSAYIKNYRFSRYQNALYSSIPFRNSNISTQELPVDSIGCFSNATFAWVRKYRVNKDNVNKNKRSLGSNRICLPKPLYADSCKVNSKRLLGTYKYEVQTNGRINGSIFRVAWKFCRTRIIVATLIHVLSILLGLNGVALFLKLTLDSMQRESKFLELSQNLSSQINKSEWNQKTNNSVGGNMYEHEIRIAHLNTILYSLGIFICIWGMHFCKGVFNWINLRTATRLRTACIASAFTKTLKSSIKYKIAPHQVMSFAGEESDIIYCFVMKGSEIFANVFGIVAYLIAALILLGAPGMWPLFGIFGLFLGALVLAKISTHFYRRSLYYSAKKVSIIEEFFKSFESVAHLHFYSFFKKQFSPFISSEYSALLKSEMFSTKFTGGITSAILLGGLYLIWCDTDIFTDSITVLVLIIMYTHFIQIMVMDCCESFLCILQGKAALEKLKNVYGLSTPEISKQKPGKNLQISIPEASFIWDQKISLIEDKRISRFGSRFASKEPFTIRVEEFFVPRNQIIGITGTKGSGKTSLLYAILGHMKLQTGNILLQDKISFFPEKPYTTPTSIKENIIFGTEFVLTKYYNAVSTTSLYDDPDMSLEYIQLELEQLQKISIARAIYCERDIILLDEPLSSLDSRISSKIMKDVVDAMIQAGKTIIIATQNDNILQYCKRIYLLEDGCISGSAEYEDITHLSSYKALINKYELWKSSMRDGDLTIDNGTADETNLNNIVKTNKLMAHTNDSFINEQMFKPKQYIWSCCGNFTITLLHLINCISYVTLPFGFVVAVMMQYIEPWLTLISLGILWLTFIVDIIIKHSVLKAARKLTKKVQKQFFEKLLHMSLNMQRKLDINEVLITFMDNYFKVFQMLSLSIQHILMAIITGSLLICINYWTAFPVVLIFIEAVIIYFRLRLSIVHFGNFENDSRKNMMHIMSNKLLGRAVIQSFDKVEEFRKEFYELIEENSTAIFMRKSVCFYAQSLFNFWQMFNLILFGLAFFLEPNIRLSTNHFALGLFLYFALTHNLNKMLEVLFEKILTKEKLNSNLKFLHNIPLKKSNIELNLKKENTSLSISFKSVSAKPNDKDIMTINELHINRSENIGITGKWSKYIAHLLLRKLDISSGTIFLGDHDILSLSRNYLEHNIGIVPRNTHRFSATIKSILNLQNDVPYNNLCSALERFHIWHTIKAMPKELDEPFYNLSEKDRQLLCLAKCWLYMPSVVIIENPHPDIQEIVDDAIRGYFLESTVIVIGSNYTQFVGCQRVVNLSHN